MEEAVYRLFLALQRMENQVPVITALLGRWLTADEVPSASTSAVGEVLERLIVATQVRYPVIGDIARNLRFRLFDEPQIRKAREQIYDGVREGLQYLADNPDAPDYAARIDALVAHAGAADRPSGTTHFQSRRAARGRHASVLRDPRARRRQDLRTGGWPVRHRQLRIGRTSSCTSYRL